MELRTPRALSFSKQQICHPLGSAKVVGQCLWEATSMCVGGWSRTTMMADFKQSGEC